MISSCASHASKGLVGIIFAGLTTCLAISSTVALWISTKNIFGFCPSLNLTAFARQQWYQIWPCMGSIIICPIVYNPIYSSSNLFCSRVQLNLEVRMYGSFRPPFWSMITITSSLCLTLPDEAWIWFGARTISFAFNTQQITTMSGAFDNSRRLLLAAGRWLPQPPVFYISQISLENLYQNITTRSAHIHWAL